MVWLVLNSQSVCSFCWDHLVRKIHEHHWSTISEGNISMPAKTLHCLQAPKSFWMPWRTVERLKIEKKTRSFTKIINSVKTKRIAKSHVRSYNYWFMTAFPLRSCIYIHPCSKPNLSGVCQYFKKAPCPAEFLPNDGFLRASPYASFHFLDVRSHLVSASHYHSNNRKTNNLLSLT